MSLEDKILAILKNAASKDNRRSTIINSLKELQIEFQLDDVSEFKRFLKSNDYATVMDIAMGDAIITVTNKGLDFANTFESKKEEIETAKKINQLKLQELESKIENLDGQLKEQSEFWRTSATANKYFWIPILLSLLALGISGLSLKHNYDKQTLATAKNIDVETTLNYEFDNFELVNCNKETKCFLTKWNTIITNNSLLPITIMDYRLKSTSQNFRLFDFGINLDDEKINLPITLQQGESIKLNPIFNIPLGKKAFKLLKDKELKSIKQVETILASESIDFFDNEVKPIFIDSILSYYEYLHITNQSMITLEIKTAKGNYFEDLIFWYKGKKFK